MSAIGRYYYYGNMPVLQKVLDPIKQRIRDTVDPDIWAEPPLSLVEEELKGIHSGLTLVNYDPYSAGCGHAKIVLSVEGLGHVDMLFTCEQS